jgi:tetratricopeptide (TPR) repeat protein
MRILLGKTYLNNEKFEKALIQFKKIENRLKTYPKLQYFMSKLYLLTDDNDKAIELAKAEIKSNPQNLEGYVLLGDIYTKEKKYNDAEEMYKKAQKIDDNDIDTMIGLSSINLKKSQFDIAIDLLLKARNVDPNNSNVHKLLGDAYRKIGQSSLATESYKIFLELSPNSRYKDEINTYLRIMR